MNWDKKQFLKCLLLPVFCIAGVGPVAGIDSISQTKINEKLEFFRVSYPKFNYQDAEAEAEKTYPMARPGEKIVLQTTDGTVEGIYKGFNNNEILIGEQRVNIKDIRSEERSRFDKVECDTLRKAKIENLFLSYTRKRARDAAEYQKKLEEQFVIEPEIDEAEPTDSPPSIKPAPTRPLIAVATNNILMSSGMVKAGELLRNIRKTGFERYSFQTEDGRNVSSDAVNIYIFKEISTPDAFEATQCALAMLTKNQFQDAYYYALLGAKIDETQKRSEIILLTIKTLQEIRKGITAANTQIKTLNKEIEYQVRMLTTNQNNLHDDFAVKAGTRDRSAVYGGKILVLREKKKAIQSEMKEKILTARNTLGTAIRRTAAAGDFISACVIMSVLEDHLSKFIEMADANWQPEELDEERNWNIEQKNFIVTEYQAKISRPFKDQWTDALDRYVALFGYNEKELTPLDIKPDYNNLLAAAKSSFNETRSFAEAVINHDFPKAFFSGMQILTLLPDPGHAEGINNWIDASFKKFEEVNAALTGLIKQKCWYQAVNASAGIKPLSTALEKNLRDAKKFIAASDQACRKAMEAEKNGNYDLAVTEATAALELCQDNPQALKFYGQLRNQHGELLRQYLCFNVYLSQNRYEDAMAQWKEMFKELPQYRMFIKQLRLRLENEMDKCANELRRADNFYKAGRYNDALEIYEKYNWEPGKVMTYNVLLKQAEAKSDWKEAARILEQLDRWEDAGEIRRRHNLEQ